MKNGQAAIVIKNLTKKFNSFSAVSDISLTVARGELFGLLGPNGAGKTTLIKMLATLLKPTSGQAMISGFDVIKDRNEVRNSIGIVFQETALDNKLTGFENLDFHSVMYGMGKKARMKKIKEVLELVELSDKSDQLVEKYSGGMKRRLEIARGLIHEPKVLFLDEPTLGLDAQTRRHIWDYIKKLNSEKEITIIITTHYMEEADYLCDRVGIMDKGKIVAIDSPVNLKNTIGADIIRLEITGEYEIDIFKNFDFIKDIKKLNGLVNLSVTEGESKIPLLLKAAQDNNIKVISVTLNKPSLEDVFLKFTGKMIRENEANAQDINRENMRRGINR